MVKPVLLFIFIVLNGVFAQTSITGSITDKDNGDPLIGANVILKGTTMGAASDVKGIYTIPNVPAGPYVVTANYIGYETVEKEVMVKGGTVNRFDFELVISTIQMETYVVTASRRRERVEDAPAAISVITKQDIRRESNTNLGDYLKTTKGLDFTQSGIDSYNITARGFNSSFSSRLMTLTDGRMANIPSLRLTAYNVIPVSFDDVEQIEIVLGPSSALYGPNAHSGVLNIISSSPLRSQGTSLNIMGGTISQ
ncbi:MAG: carboxypeptidase-like regulatory domain-containing protein, partial [Candidatus Neomarinimicrobiota bacterium]|nr:carboxypeptidase-like regulatory domain-containing protein [Candidatus Neomarinimicrobiota bacterium]